MLVLQEASHGPSCDAAALMLLLYEWSMICNAPRISSLCRVEIELMSHLFLPSIAHKKLQSPQDQAYGCCKHDSDVLTLRMVVTTPI